MTGKEAMQVENRKHTTSEVRVSCRKLDRVDPQQEDTAALWAEGMVPTKTVDVLPSEAPTTTGDAEQEEDINGLWASGSGTVMVRLGTVDRAKWVSMNGDLRCASAAFVRMDACVALLNNSKDVLDHKCVEL